MASSCAFEFVLLLLLRRWKIPSEYWQCYINSRVSYYVSDFFLGLIYYEVGTDRVCWSVFILTRSIASMESWMLLHPFKSLFGPVISNLHLNILDSLNKGTNLLPIDPAITPSYPCLCAAIPSWQVGFGSRLKLKCCDG